MSPAFSPALNPAQRRVLDVLGSSGPLPEFPADVGARLRAQLEDELEPVAAGRGPDQTLYVSKHLLSLVHGCEARMLGEDGGEFAVTVPIARGSVAHKAIELGIHWRGDAHPLDLVDEALAQLIATDHWLSDWLTTCSEADRALLRSEAGDRVSKFVECFPALQNKWRPVTESRRIVELLDGRIRLQGRVDLTIGTARGTAAGKVVIDLKTGGRSSEHRSDLHFYALLETICQGVPPRLVASYYLDQGVAQPEVVTEGMLEASLARTVDGVARIVRLRSGEAVPVKRTSWACRWCAVRVGCAEGNAHLRALGDLDDLENSDVMG